MEITKRQTIFLLLFVILLPMGIIASFEFDKNNQNETARIFKNGKFSIGIVTDFTPEVRHFRVSPTEYSKVQIEFLVRDSLVLGQQYGNIFFTPRNSLNVGTKYLVVFDSINPSCFRILFDRPVNDSNDFIKYTNNSSRIFRDLLHYDAILDK